ncbi:phosphate ABC transporter permease PstA [Anaerococcus hydrogenalis]|uniref:Phosphate transport system permease protein PstA n=2 Tax=Anaerococcus hydrogenalis TaxID=33029 RepID=F0H0C0_9FIRM|nr:phosphate ABC transporter permease PstA [Anaerococcus hydrogenalis]EGC84033.1 phosphate ABC transporter, permease protein PstA [Anaerococcus hydrogenalis ACS-025-V-Sch4]MBS5988652.1 phosphate ABC transporter permease PstA [Anaerococcus hydrogenalis]MDK7694168.1 phosphate ABC transporter permease PstA [Anaerococcus hydrogenalis]MDK7695946.1 phosphate ABC transporter permease PstA [Anaerococcus hydrogenalis]MDK7707195.1 phosphate ABC transporter permease PstA [Anaerococcus hydrogenalis]
MKNSFKILIYILSILGFAAGGVVIAYILFNGIPNISPSLFELKYSSQNVSIIPALITTFLSIIITLLVTLPIGIFTAIYLSQYAKNKFLIKAVRFATEILSSIPSIVYGLFGYLFFVDALHLGYSLIAGCLTVAIMILPTIIRTTEEAILNVNPLQAHASLALGATKIQTIFKIIIPEAINGILGGIFLSTGRIVGESAALIYTMGTVAKTPSSLFDSARTMAVHMYVLSTEGFHVNEAYATAVLLLIFVIVLNFVSARISKALIK